MDQLVTPPDIRAERSRGFLAKNAAWVMVASAWLVALALVAALFWVLPQAAVSRRFAGDAAGLRASLSPARAELDRARAELATIQAQLVALESEQTKMQGAVGQNAKLIDDLKKQIAVLNEHKAAAEAAAAAITVAEAKVVAQIPSPPGPPTPCFTIYDPNGVGHVTCYTPP
jgi:septal ring factor EnvC (AmiA/AmiB activator)